MSAEMGGGGAAKLWRASSRQGGVLSRMHWVVVGCELDGRRWRWSWDQLSLSLILLQRGHNGAGPGRVMFSEKY